MSEQIRDNDLEERIKREFGRWPKGSLGKLKCRIEEDPVTKKHIVWIEKFIGDEEDPFPEQHDTKFRVGIFATEAEAGEAWRQTVSVLSDLAS